MNSYPLISKTKRSALSLLSQTKHRRKAGVFLVEGDKNVSDLLSKGKFEPVWMGASEEYFKKQGDNPVLTSLFAPDNINLCKPEDLKHISSFSTPPQVIVSFKIPECDFDPLQNGLRREFYLLLDGIQDPGNLGTIIRTAHWFGIKQIFASKNCVDVYNPKTVQSSMGSLGEVDIIYTDLPELVKNNPDLPCVGLQLEGDNLFRSELPDSALICMGSEGNGLTEELQTLLTASYTIPPADSFNHPESLNVAIATAITLSCFCR